MSETRRVFVDPDGTVPYLLGVIIQHPTGVRYEHQCGGVETLQLSAEGYFVPLGGVKIGGEGEAFQPEQLMEVFHQGGGCLWRGDTSKLPPNSSHLSEERLDRLRLLVEEIPYWACDSAGTEQRTHLRLDETRLGELVEAWAPVTTPDGPGVLIWENCD